MSTKHELGQALADQWLAMQNPFGKNLVDTGRRHQGFPVFDLEVVFPSEHMTMRVYRYTPAHSEHSRLAFIPEH